MKHLKKILALALIAVSLFAVALPAMAAGSSDIANPKSLGALGSDTGHLEFFNNGDTLYYSVTGTKVSVGVSGFFWHPSSEGDMKITLRQWDGKSTTNPIASQNKKPTDRNSNSQQNPGKGTEKD